MGSEPARLIRGGAFAWLAELAPGQRRTLIACVAGWSLDGMDVQLYTFIIPILLATWGITRSAAGELATAALLASSVGGLLGGYAADRIGRVRTLQISIAWFAGFTFLSGLAQSFDQLFLARALMGLGFGGEWAAGAVLIGETINPKHRGKALGTMQAGWAVGWAAAAVLNLICYALFPPALAWRAMFFAGVAPALLILFVRRYVEEPDIYRRSRAALEAAGERPSGWEIFRPPLLRITFLGGLLGTGAQGGYAAVVTWLPTYLRTERHLSVPDSTAYLAVLISGSFCGYMSGAYLADRIGRRFTFLFFAIGSVLMVLIYTMVGFGNTAIFYLGAPLMFFGSGVFSAQGAFLTEQFPTRIRGVGQGFTYNVGRAVGALFPTFVGALSALQPLGRSIGLCASIAYGLMALAAFLLPETRGKVLQA